MHTIIVSVKSRLYISQIFKTPIGHYYNNGKVILNVPFEFCTSGHRKRDLAMKQKHISRNVFK